MFLIQQSLDLCDAAARARALETVFALAHLHPNAQPLLAERIYCACKARDAETGYTWKHVAAPAWPSAEESAAAERRAAQALGLAASGFDAEVEDRLCDAFEALSGHLPEEQRRIASALRNLAVEFADLIAEPAVA